MSIPSIASNIGPATTDDIKLFPPAYISSILVVTGGRRGVIWLSCRVSESWGIAKGVSP